MERPGTMLTACGSTTDPVVGQFQAAPRFDWIAVLLPYLYPDLVDRGMRSAPFPNPESNWTTLRRCALTLIGTV